MNSSNSNAIFTDPRAKRWGHAVSILALLGLGFLVAPYVWLAIGGLLGLLTGAGVCVGAWMIRPWVYAKAANLRLSLVKQEARTNPIETLENEYLQKQKNLDTRKQNIVTLDGKIRTFADKVAAIAKKYGTNDPDYIKLSGDLGQLRSVLVKYSEKWNEAHRQLGLFAEAIQRGRMIYDAAMAGRGAQEASGLSEEDFMSQLRIETSFDAIQDSYNEALAGLDSILLDGSPVTKIGGALTDGNERNTINVTPEKSKSKA